jgi:CheY-like chemotaxis protein
MPDLDGPAVVSRIRAEPTFAALPVILLTSDHPAAGARRDTGAAAVLTKPVGPSELFAALGRALGVALAGAEKAAVARPRGSRALSILVAEDNPVNQRLAVRLLERQGHTVVVAGNGEEALAALEQRPFDLVLMDVQMPGMDGLQATASIRRREAVEGGHVPIVAMTAHAMAGDRDRCLAAGMDAYVAKPVRADDLYTVIGTFAASPSSEAGAEP